MIARPALITCEHAAWRVPQPWADRLGWSERALRSHRGWDPGSLSVAAALSRRLKAPLLAGQVSRLLVDLNRREGHPQLHHPRLRLAPGESARLLSRYHRPFRFEAERLLRAAARRKGRALHLSLHSFTPRRNGVVRDFELGILFDPRRRGEAAVARKIRAMALENSPGLRVRFNRPYAGRAEGHTTWLRERFPDRAYAGIELEFNQAWLARLDPAANPLAQAHWKL